MDIGYPLTLDVSGRHVVVVGGGPVAARRASALATAGAAVLVVAPEVCEELVDLVESNAVTWRRAAYSLGDLDRAWVVHTATGDRAVDSRVAADADAARVWCVRADDASLSAAWTPAVARVGSAIVAVTTSGDPRRAARLRSAIAVALDSGHLPLRHQRPQLRGRVDLVGGGPGDPGLITTAGRLLLAEADVVVVDRLAPAALLTDLDPEVEVIDVGKTHGNHPVRQHEINALLIEHARAGRRVVRLKGGDPFVFGRGGEEVLACRAAGVDVAVTPGVTSAVAVPAGFGIPVTHREASRSFTVVTGHDGIDATAVPPDGTVVLLMGLSMLDRIATALVANGRDLHTPVAVLEDGFGPRHRKITGTLDTIVDQVRDAGVKAPAIIVVGEVVTLADQISPPSGGMRDPIVLVAHGSRDPESSQVNNRIAELLRTRLPGTTVVVSQLDHAGPRPHEAVDALAAVGHRSIRIQPLLFTPAYHVTVDLPEVLSESVALASGKAHATVQPPLVTHPGLLDALDRRLDEAMRLLDGDGAPAFTALVLSSAGTTSAAARVHLAAMAAHWGGSHGVPAVAAFASAAEPTPGQAVARLVSAGHRVAVGSLFFGPGFLPTRAREQALAAGATAVAAHIGDAPELIDVLVDRYQAPVLS